MLGTSMRFATVCALSFAICGKAKRNEVAPVPNGNTEDHEHRFRQETNFEDHLATPSRCSRVRRRLVVILTLNSAVTSSAAFAPILTNNPLDSTHDMLRPVNANRANFTLNLATPQVFSHDIKLYANRQGEEAQAQVASKPLEHPTPADVEAFLEHPTSVDAYLFRTLNKYKDCRPMLEFSNWKTPEFNVYEENIRQVSGNVPKWPSLSAVEKAALWTYTQKDADIINQIARGADKVEFKDYHSDPIMKNTVLHCTLTKEDMLPWIKFLNAGLNRMPSAAPGRLYHGVGFDAEGSPGSIAPITGFSSFSEDFNVAKCFVEENRKDGIQPTIFVMDKHSSGRQLDMSLEHKEVVFRVGTKFVIEEDEKVQREVEALWRENFVSDHPRAPAKATAYNWLPSKGPRLVPDFKVLVVREVP